MAQIGITTRPGGFKHDAVCWLIQVTSDQTVGTLVWTEKMNNNNSFRGVIKVAAIFKHFAVCVYDNKQVDNIPLRGGING